MNEDAVSKEVGKWTSVSEIVYLPNPSDLDRLDYSPTKTLILSAIRSFRGAFSQISNTFHPRA